jgi:hypothetical protein
MRVLQGRVVENDSRGCAKEMIIVLARDLVGATRQGLRRRLGDLNVGNSDIKVIILCTVEAKAIKCRIEHICRNQ